MIKILFLIHDLSQGGAEKVLVNLVNNMNHKEFDISVIALFGGGVNEQFLSSEIHYHFIWERMIRGNSKIMKLLSPNQLYKKCVGNEKYDIVISYLEGPSARIVSGCTDPKTKLVSWIHVEQHDAKKASRAFRSIKEAKNCYLKFDKTIAVSDYVANDFHSIFSDINPEVLYNTVESDVILRKSRELVSENLFHSEEIKLCGIGTLKKSKGFDRLLRIHKKLIDEKFPVHTYLLGSGEEEENLKRWIKKNNLEKSFTFLGYQTNPYKYTAKCDLFICTSFAEGFSTAATESLIVGTPVCTVEVSGMKEMLGENNEYGIITENDEEALYEAIKGLIGSPDLLNKYKRKARERGKLFSTEQTVAATEKMLKGLTKV
ncbi:glycosyltransferase [Anaerostipes faecalis]|uniref:glycosyltransferase n=1 Tax=Anaerostipes faecalis TaxID=2738446 RepID=UPI001C1DF9FF|nr:glycosyltransferase [Anaerostipes faecalis]